MITKEQALDAAQHGLEIHYVGRHDCTRTVGPRGGVTEKTTRVRPSGRCQTWKRDTSRFRLPVKYGLYESSAITEDNAADWHMAYDCPLLHKEGAQ